MNQSEIDKIKICRVAIDKYRYFREQEKTIVTDNLERDRMEQSRLANEVMKEQGFVDEVGNGSIGVFTNWYRTNIFELFKECYPLKGGCHGCKGLDTPRCAIWYGYEESCFHKKNKEPIDMNYWHVLRNRLYKLSKEQRKDYVCPEGGIDFDDEQRKEPPIGIDFDWRV